MICLLNSSCWYYIFQGITALGAVAVVVLTGITIYQSRLVRKQNRELNDTNVKVQEELARISAQNLETAKQTLALNTFNYLEITDIEIRIRDAGLEEVSIRLQPENLKDNGKRPSKRYIEFIFFGISSAQNKYPINEVEIKHLSICSDRVKWETQPFTVRSKCTKQMEAGYEHYDHVYTLLCEVFYFDDAEILDALKNQAVNIQLQIRSTYVTAFNSYRTKVVVFGDYEMKFESEENARLRYKFNDNSLYQVEEVKIEETISACPTTEVDT